LPALAGSGLQPGPRPSLAGGWRCRRRRFAPEPALCESHRPRDESPRPPLMGFLSTWDCYPPTFYKTNKEFIMAQHDTRNAGSSNRSGQLDSPQERRRQREAMQRAQIPLYERNDLTGVRPDSDDRFQIEDDEYASVYGRHLITDNGRYDDLRARTEGRAQNFRGRGPKGYQRTDERILEEV